jgi:7,8-dihydropterin-6-yl-methyl-4-(beta-D-ribofuranosyl)aminobenzene 5'-phosphate synthase
MKPRFAIVTLVILAFAVPVSMLAQGGNAQKVLGNPASHAQIKNLKVTVLSTMVVGESVGLGEWGFSALVEADGNRILIDTGAHPNTVLQNARDLKIDLSDVKEVILTHNHWDHVRGLMTLRKEMLKKNPAALSIAHVARGIFYSRPSAHGEDNDMIVIRKEYEATGGKFIEHDGPVVLFPGAWLTGPIPRKYPERNWSVSGKVQTPEGLVEDTIPEDQSLVLNTAQGLVVITGCGHAGIINILTFTAGEFPGEPVHAILGGLHLFPASDEQLNWTADMLKGFKMENLLAAHCTGMEATYRIRQRLGLPRKAVVVGTVGSTFILGEGIQTGPLAR